MPKLLRGASQGAEGLCSGAALPAGQSPGAVRADAVARQQPGTDLVSKAASHTGWLLAQHSSMWRQTWDRPNVMLGCGAAAAKKVVYASVALVRADGGACCIPHFSSLTSILPWVRASSMGFTMPKIILKKPGALMMQVRPSISG